MGNVNNLNAGPQPFRKAATGAPKPRQHRPGERRAARHPAPAATARGNRPATAAGQELLKPDVRDGTAGVGGAHELFGPHEWDALLAGLDYESTGAAPRGPHPGADDLWERLAKARWLPKRANEVKPEGNSAQRPSA